MFAIIPSIEQNTVALVIHQLLTEVFVERQEGVGGVVKEELEAPVKLMLQEVYLTELFCISRLIHCLNSRRNCF